MIYEINMRDSVCISRITFTFKYEISLIFFYNETIITTINNRLKLSLTESIYICERFSHYIQHLKITDNADELNT